MSLTVNPLWRCTQNLFRRGNRQQRNVNGISQVLSVSIPVSGRLVLVNSAPDDRKLTPVFNKSPNDTMWDVYKDLARTEYVICFGRRQCVGADDRRVSIRQKQWLQSGHHSR